MPNIVTQIEWPYEKNIDSWYFSNCINLEGGTISALSFASQGCDVGDEELHTFSKASLVSVCTIVTKFSSACCKYSAAVWMPNFSIGNGEPKPRWPAGGNLADWTSFLASFSSWRRGTIIPWAWKGNGYINQWEIQSHPSRCHNARIQGSYYVPAGQPFEETEDQVGNGSRLTIQASLAAILTTGLTPQVAIAATASYMALSAYGGGQSIHLKFTFTWLRSALDL